MRETIQNFNKIARMIKNKINVMFAEIPALILDFPFTLIIIYLI